MVALLKWSLWSNTCSMILIAGPESMLIWYENGWHGSGFQSVMSFFMLWSELTIKLHAMISGLENRHVSNETLNLFWNAIFSTLYLDYDTSTDFLPQFRQRHKKLSTLCQGVMEIGNLLPDNEMT